MTVRNQSGQPIDPLHNSGQFQASVSNIVVDQTTVVAVFNHDTGITTITWTRPLSERIIGNSVDTSEKYDIYRKPIFTPNINGNFPITEDVPNAAVERIAANLPYIDPSQNSGSYEYTVPSGMEGWYFYAVVVKFNTLSQKVIPDYGVWESETVVSIAAPVLTVTSTGQENVALSWTTISDALGYKVFYCDKSMADNSVLIQWTEPPINAPLISGTTTIVTGLHNDTVYYFRVRAVNTINHEGPFSNEASGMPKADTVPPDRVTALTTEDLGIGGSVRVCWTGYTVPVNLKNYRIYYSNQIFSNITSGTIPYIVVSASDTCSIVTGLINGSQYWFAVVPVNNSDVYYSDSLFTKVGTPTLPSQVGYANPITVTVNNVVRAVPGISSPHVIYGFIQLPSENAGQISLGGIYITAVITLSSLGGINESLNVVTDNDGFWSVNLANLNLGEWKNNDFISIQAKDWTSPFLGSASLYVDNIVGSQRVDILISDSSLQYPVLISPINGGTSEYPVFRLYSQSQNNNLKFKIEVSDDNFRTILRVFDEQSNALGWGRDTQSINSVDTIIAVYSSFQNDRLVNGEVYQWRAYVWNGVRYSLASSIAQFNVVAEQLDKESEIWNFNIDADSIVNLSAVVTDNGRYDTPNANGIIITDSTPIFEWQMDNITVHNVHFRFEIDTNSDFANDDGNLRIYDSKDIPDGFEFSYDKSQWVPFTRMGAPSGVQYFRYVFSKNLAVV